MSDSHITTQTDAYRYSLDVHSGTLLVTGKVHSQHTYKMFKHAVMLTAKDEHVYVVTRIAEQMRTYKFVISNGQLCYVG